MVSDQPKPLTAIDLANSPDLRRAVSWLVEEEINKLQAAHDKKEGSILNRFAGEVSVTGLSDAIRAKHKILKVLWLLIFLGGLAATTFFVYRVFDEYKNEPTATKVNIIRETNYTFPRIVLCVDTWVNAEKAMAMGLSKEGIKYALSYLIPFEDVATEVVDESKNVSGLEQEFLDVYEDPRYNFTSLIDFFKYIALDAVEKSNDEKVIRYECSGCIHSKKLEKVIIDKSVCYILRLKEVDGKLRQSYGLPEYDFRVPDLSHGILSRRAYWKLYVNPTDNHLLSDTPYVSVYEQQAHSVRIKSEHYEMSPRGHDPCIEQNDPNFVNYSSLSCVIGWAWSVYREAYGCSVLNLDQNHTRPLPEYCNTYYWTKWPRPAGIDRRWMRARMLRRVARCRQECSIWWYSNTVDAHYSNSLVKAAKKRAKRNETDAIHLRDTKLYFINMDVLAGGVVTFIEVSTYSFQTLVGNIGGTCGIWIGVSVMTLIQLFMFFIERTLDSVFSVKKPKATVNGKNKAEQAALV